ncbi:MAG: hypothetical protein M3P37_07610 [Actinomycetota bacterium]|nr:hypothetical protein [Actinomycetota bacterium]
MAHLGTVAFKRREIVKSRLMEGPIQYAMGEPGTAANSEIGTRNTRGSSRPARALAATVARAQGRSVSFSNRMKEAV